MSFNKENLVGIAQKSISANNYEESKASNVALDTHTQNQGIHVSFEDRKRWDEQSKVSKDYVDYRFKTIWILLELLNQRCHFNGLWPGLIQQTPHQV